MGRLALPLSLGWVGAVLLVGLIAALGHEPPHVLAFLWGFWILAFICMGMGNDEADVSTLATTIRASMVRTSARSPEGRMELRRRPLLTSIGERDEAADDCAVGDVG